MLAVLFIVLLLPAALFRGLQSVFYVAHICMVLGVYALWRALDNRLMYNDLFSFEFWQLYILGIVVFISINLVTFVAYAWDKRAARRQAWRVPERTLHGLALFGGTPCALLAMRLLRHKNKKKSFRMRMWAICFVQMSFLTFFFAKVFLLL